MVSWLRLHPLYHNIAMHQVRKKLCELRANVLGSLSYAPSSNYGCTTGFKIISLITYEAKYTKIHLTYTLCFNSMAVICLTYLAVSVTSLKFLAGLPIQSVHHTRIDQSIWKLVLLLL